MMRLVLAQAAVKETVGGDPVAHARAVAELASTLYEMSRRGLGDTRAAAADNLARAMAAFEQHLPDTRADLANAHYLCADMARGRDHPTAQRHFEAALALVRREEEPMLWAAVNEGLAAALIRGPEADVPAVQERSIELYQEALTVEPPQVPGDHWAMSAHGLALTLVERHRGTVVANWLGVLEVTDQALGYAMQGDDGRLKHWLFEINQRARIGYGLAALFGGALPDAEGMRHVREGARGLDVLRDERVTPLVDRLEAALGARAETKAGLARFLEAVLAIVEEIDDRRSRVMVHLLLASNASDVAERTRHASEAARLISPHDDEALREAVADLATAP